MMVYDKQWTRGLLALLFLAVHLPVLTVDQAVGFQETTMTEAMTSHKVWVKRNQDSEPWLGTTRYEAFIDVLNEDKSISRGASVGYAIEDERGFLMFAQRGQMTDAEAGNED